MAERRMFAKTIVLSDAFLDMPMSARCLYFTLGMLADDDGFVNSPKSIMRQCGASTDDMNLLIAKKFVLVFDDGVIVIKHWRINNYLRSDRYAETKYIEHKEELSVDDNGAYTVGERYTSGIPTANQSVYPVEDRLGKDRIDNNSARFTPPTPTDVERYATEKGLTIDADKFCDFYESKGWMVGKNKMKDWKAAVRGWCSRDKKTQQPQRSEKVQRAFGFSTERTRNSPDYVDYNKLFLESAKKTWAEYSGDEV